jgi:hypothetical protein
VAGTTSTVLASGTFDNANPGDTLTIATPQAATIDNVALVRNTAITHEVDGDQRTVDAPVISRTGSTITVKIPGSANVIPPGPYMLFINQKTPKGDIPSIAKQIFVGAQPTPVPVAPPTPGLTAPDYKGIQTNDTPAQLQAFIGFVSSSLLKGKL